MPNRPVTPLSTATAAIVLASAVGATLAAQQLATPEIREIEELEANGERIYVMRGELGDTGEHLGFAAVCSNRQLEVTVFFGSFPARGTPVQLAIRTASGSVERFGPVVRASGPRSGFHSPQIRNPREVVRFLANALETGALVSNGYRSFWNRVPPAQNRNALSRMRGCTRR